MRVADPVDARPAGPTRRLARCGPARLAARAIAVLTLVAGCGLGNAQIAAEDLVALLDPSLPPHQQTWSGLNCNGLYVSLARHLDLNHAERADHRALPRFDTAPDPLAAGRSTYAFRVLAGDLPTAGALRCEAVAPPARPTALPMGSAFWYVFRILVWQGQEARSGSALLTQWHVHGFNPFLGLTLRQGHLDVTVRHDQAADGAAQRKPTLLQLWRDDALVARRWMTFVVQADIRRAGTSMLRIWRDGEPIVEYAGPLGYDDPGLAYAKIGYYHWLNNNPWDEAVDQRLVLVGKAALVRDASGRYTEAQLRRWVSE